MQFESFHRLSNHADHRLYRENMIAVVQNKLFFFSLTSLSISDLDGRDPMTVGHWLRHHVTETKNNFGA